MNTRFVENIIHDLKVPLISQMRGIELVKNLADSENDLKNEILSEIYNSCRQSLKLISDLAYSCSLENSLRNNKECLSVQEILNQVVNEITPIAISKNISFCFSESDNSVLFMDRQHIRNILLNIIYNAILYSHNNEKISINHTVKYGVVNINIVSKGFILTDEEYRNIIDKNSDFRQYSAVGQGISLHLSKQILELNEGKLLFSSDGISENKFEIILPALTMKNCKLCQ